GETIRNFVYTDVFDNIAREINLSLLSVMPNSDFRDLLTERYGNAYELREVQERWVVNIMREILDMAHGRWLWSEAARERWRLREAEAVTPALRLRRQAKKLACYPFANRAGLRLLSNLERTSSRLFRTTDEYIRLFKQVRPSLVFNGSHVHSRV